MGCVCVHTQSCNYIVSIVRVSGEGVTALFLDFFLSEM